MQWYTTFVMTVLYVQCHILDRVFLLTVYYNRNNERIIGQISWNNRENDEEIWNRIIGTIGSALLHSGHVRSLFASAA